MKLCKHYAAAAVESISGQMPRDLYRSYNLNRNYSGRVKVNDDRTSVSSGQVLFILGGPTVVRCSNYDGHTQDHSWS